MSEFHVETFEVPQIGGTPYYGWAVQVHAELLRDGAVDLSELLFHPHCSAIVAKVGPDTVGTIVFDTDTRGVICHAAYVHPEYRRRGVFGLMFDELLRAAGRRGLRRIGASAPHRAASYAKALVAVGLRAEATTFAGDFADP